MKIKREIKYILIEGSLITVIIKFDEFSTALKNANILTIDTKIKTIIVSMLLVIVVSIFLWRVSKIFYSWIFEKGRKKGYSEGIIAAYYNRPNLYKNLISSCQKFIKELSKHHLNKLGCCLIQKFSEEPESWNKLVGQATTNYLGNLSEHSQKNWQELAKTTACQYINATNAARKGEKGPPILLSNFNIYAECVSSILETLVDPKKNFGNRIRVWTLLNKPLTYWYNMLAISKGAFHCTQDWWEMYKVRVSNLKENNKIQIRRIIVDQKTDDGKILEDLYLYKENGFVKPITIREAISRMSEFKDMNLIEDVRKALSTIEDFYEEKIYIIASPSKRINKKVTDDNNLHVHWQALSQHFLSLYHTKFKRYLKDEKGVYYCFVSNREIEGDRELSSFLLCDDIFLVEFNENNTQIDGFGIALNIDEKYDIVGITILSGYDLNMTRKALNSKWQEGESYVKKLRE